MRPASEDGADHLSTDLQSRKSSSRPRLLTTLEETAQRHVWRQTSVNILPSNWHLQLDSLTDFPIPQLNDFNLIRD